MQLHQRHEVWLPSSHGGETAPRLRARSRWGYHGPPCLPGALQCATGECELSDQVEPVRVPLILKDRTSRPCLLRALRPDVVGPCLATFQLTKQYQRDVAALQQMVL